MADIRINSLPTTASASSSDDFLALDGATNGTRKLNAYSPTFGGNLTVSGTTGSTFGQIARTNGTNATVLTLSDNLTGVSTAGFGLQIRGTSNNGGCVSAIGFENGGTGTNNETQFSVYTQNAANALTKQFTIGSTGNATLANNLTVSGGTITGGTSGLSLASGGTNQNITLTPSGTGKVTVSNGTTAQPVFDITNTNTVPTKNGLRILGPNATSSSARQFALIANSIAYGDLELRRSTTNTGDPTSGDYIFGVSATGNFLLGTTTDSANGKLQLATHTTSAGGIGFGTDISLYRDTNSTLNGTAPGGYALNRTGMNGVGLATGVNVASDAKTANDAIGISLSLQNSSSAAKTYGQIYAEINSATASSENGSLVLRTIKAGTLTTALTLDSSQNATFANGLVVGKAASVNTITGGDAGGGTYIIQFKDGVGAAKVNITGDGKTILLNTTASTSTTTGALQVSGGVGVAGAVNVGGAIAIGNTVNTVSPTSPNRTITMVIGGTTYYIHAKTTND